MKPGQFKIPNNDIDFNSTTAMTITVDSFSGRDEDTFVRLGDQRTVSLPDTGLMTTVSKHADTRTRFTT